MTSQPCLYVCGVQEKRDAAGKMEKLLIYCGKVCDAGATMCPRHLLVHRAQTEKKAAREDKRRKYFVDQAKRTYSR